MKKLSPKQQEIISILLKNSGMRSSEIHAQLLKGGEDISLVTSKRMLVELAGQKLINAYGAGRSTGYEIGILGRLFADIDPRTYCAVEPDKRYGMERYNFDLFAQLPVEVFNAEELNILKDATTAYKKRTQEISAVIQKKELERLIIELSWKSSRIEGNTYTLLETEKLILENKEAAGHSKNEAQMILNHKDALIFVKENATEFMTLTRANLEKLHSILVKSLEVNFGLRKSPVGITGVKYRPLESIYQIEEAIGALASAINKTESGYAKALLAVLGISYIQPFEDGNKRTSRLMANALLLSHGLAPLSYRSVDESDYRQAVIVFYELNSLVPFKKIFVSQYEFAANNYAIKPLINI
jgi:Fic family protein